MVAGDVTTQPKSYVYEISVLNVVYKSMGKILICKENELTLVSMTEVDQVGNTNWGRPSTVDLLIKVACFVKN